METGKLPAKQPSQKQTYLREENSTSMPLFKGPTLAAWATRAVYAGLAALLLFSACEIDEPLQETDKVEKTRGEDFASDPRLDTAHADGLKKHVALGTDHDYENETDQTWTISQPDAGSISIHFARFQTERNYDFVYIYDQNNTLKKVYHGLLTDFWTEPIDGNQLKIRFVSDQSITHWGFFIDSYSYTASASIKGELAWESEQRIVESFHDYDSDSNESFVVQKSGADSIKVHFSRLETEKGFDKIFIYDAVGQLIETYTGIQSDFWTPEVAGDTIKIVLRSDATIEAYGFRVDTVAWAIDTTPVLVGASQYPIVMHHGFIGFDNILFVDYFYKVESRLEESGFLVYPTEVPAVQRISVRAKYLKAIIDDVLQTTGADKVNIIAHSQGGLDARYLISSLGYGDRVASLTTIATPHRGISAADIAVGKLPGPVKALVSLFLKMLTPVYNQASRGGNTDTWGAINDMTQEHMQNTFNPQNPDDPDVYYQSWTGKSSITSIGTGDFLDPVFYVSYGIIKTMEGSNDGLVSVNSARWGNFRGTIPADHMDEVGQLFGTTSWRFDHLDFYEDIAFELAEMGY